MTVFLGHICGKSSGRFQETNLLFLKRYPVIPNEEKKLTEISVYFYHFLGNIHLSKSYLRDNFSPGMTAKYDQISFNCTENGLKIAAHLFHLLSST